MTYIIPDIKADYFLKFKEVFLSENNLQIGSSIIWPFDYEKISTNYDGRGQSKYVFQKECEGILKEDASGFLYAESIEKLPFYELKKQGRKEWYGSEYRHSIHKFGTGFLFF